MTIGQGDRTWWKQEGYRHSLLSSLKLANSVKVRHHTFWLADMTCGSGYCDKADCYGSAVVALNLLVEMRSGRFRAFFRDNDKEAIALLRERVKMMGLSYGDRDGPIHIWSAGDNDGFLEDIAERMAEAGENPRYVFGATYLDSNGPSPTRGFRVDQQATFSKEHPRMDHITNVNVSALNRSRCVKKGKTKRAMQQWPARYLSQVIGLFGDDREWLIREPNLSSGHYYVMIVGRERLYLRSPADTVYKFYPLCSPMGQRILQWSDREELEEWEGYNEDRRQRC